MARAGKWARWKLHAQVHGHSGTPGKQQRGTRMIDSLAGLLSRRRAGRLRTQYSQQVGRRRRKEGVRTVPRHVRALLGFDIEADRSNRGTARDSR